MADRAARLAGVATKSAISQNGGHWVATRFWVARPRHRRRPTVLRHGSGWEPGGLPVACDSGEKQIVHGPKRVCRTTAGGQRTDGSRPLFRGGELPGNRSRYGREVDRSMYSAGDVFACSFTCLIVVDAAQCVKRHFQPSGRNGPAGGDGERSFWPSRVLWDLAWSRVLGASSGRDWICGKGRARKFAPSESWVAKKSRVESRGSRARIFENLEVRMWWQRKRAPEPLLTSGLF